MFILYFVASLISLSWLNFVTASLTSLNSNFQIRNAPGASSADTLRLISRSLAAANLKREANVLFKNSTSLDTSWDGVLLFSIAKDIESGNENVSISAAVEVYCTTCYMKGIATAQLSMAENFNFSQAFDNVTSDIADEIEEFSTAVVDYVETTFDNITDNLMSDGFDPEDFNFPPIEIDFDIDIPDIPECELEFQFDKLELYMQLNTVLSIGSTYTINLFTSNTPIGAAIGDNLEVGIIFTVDLILDVDAEIDISSGFHILLNDGITINIPLFSKNVSDMNFNGGDFEFLPVTIKSASVILVASLRIGVKAAFGFSIPLDIDNSGIKGAQNAGVLEIGAGVEAGVWVDIAKFKTNITVAPATNGNECELRVIEEYEMAIGANAGASLSIWEYDWGPELEVSIPVYYTTLTDICAISKTTTATTEAATATGSIQPRDGLETTTSEIEVTLTAIKCSSTGLANCPVSLQTTLKNTVTKTLTATIAPGAEATFTTDSPIVSAIAFGTNIRNMDAINGSPTSWIPKSSAPSGSGDEDGDGGEVHNVFDKETGRVSNKIIIGVSVGLGIPVLLGIIAGLVFFCRRRRAASIKTTEPTYKYQPALQTPESPNLWSDVPDKKSPNIAVAEYQPHA